jgi:hypothetical protein
MKKAALVFVVSFILNLVWENAHAYLYAHYMGVEITRFILLRATLVDALIITVISLPFLYFAILKHKGALIIPTGLVIAFAIEHWALSTGRWAYKEFMPVVPLLEVGLTPLIQLGFLGYASYSIAVSLYKNTT